MVEQLNFAMIEQDYAALCVHIILLYSDKYTTLPLTYLLTAESTSLVNARCRLESRALQGLTNRPIRLIGLSYSYSLIISIGPYALRNVLKCAVLYSAFLSSELLFLWDAFGAFLYIIFAQIHTYENPWTKIFTLMQLCYRVVFCYFTFRLQSESST